ncbi:hypothetical protein [Pseudoalteromonas sp. meg-B1]
MKLWCNSLNYPRYAFTISHMKITG